eukprot:scaffold109838_cov63-Phaeocystis_antarctica.AAC.2
MHSCPAPSSGSVLELKMSHASHSHMIRRFMVRVLQARRTLGFACAGLSLRRATSALPKQVWQN